MTWKTCGVVKERLGTLYRLYNQHSQAYQWCQEPFSGSEIFHFPAVYASLRWVYWKIATGTNPRRLLKRAEHLHPLRRKDRFFSWLLDKPLACVVSCWDLIVSTAKNPSQNNSKPLFKGCISTGPVLSSRRLSLGILLVVTDWSVWHDGSLPTWLNQASYWSSVTANLRVVPFSRPSLSKRGEINLLLLLVHWVEVTEAWNTCPLTTVLYVPGIRFEAMKACIFDFASR